ncbi:hypothetical protein AVEN_87537-1 [Araneus ventricosus]|uniref:Uncharacterized protein n=1 Tax=Araneus ventricosus TaxID=182803 RepID=A0A4Y2NPY0_ARAVE|nr:hypothetical protein AVEN_87537-1 [Araneus ventricosus]
MKSNGLLGWHSVRKSMRMQIPWESFQEISTFQWNREVSRPRELLLSAPGCSTNWCQPQPMTQSTTLCCRRMAILQMMRTCSLVLLLTNGPDSLNGLHKVMNCYST